MSATYAEFFGAHRPARTVVPTKELHYDCAIEVDALATLWADALCVDIVEDASGLCDFNVILAPDDNRQEAVLHHDFVGL